MCESWSENFALRRYCALIVPNFPCAPTKCRSGSAPLQGRSPTQLEVGSPCGGGSATFVDGCRLGWDRSGRPLAFAGITRDLWRDLRARPNGRDSQRDLRPLAPGRESSRDSHVNLSDSERLFQKFVSQLQVL